MAIFDEGMLPPFAEEFLIYMESIRGKSQNTIHEYYYDLLMFFRFLSQRRRLVSGNPAFEDIDVRDFPREELRTVNLTDLYAFLNYMNKERKDQAPTRARKVACLRSFFKYAQSKANLVDQNPALELESPKITKRLPRYLDLEESRDLLNSIDGTHRERDFCMITLFLNCGMRLSELVGINLGDIDQDTLVVTGKGAKERTIYLNPACLAALEAYLRVRPIPPVGSKDREALFLSSRKQRISPKTVQYTVKKYLTLANLDAKKYSTHKLRHTAATLMYTHGDVDIRSLQEILGHESVSTTEIYTHVNNAKLKDAVNKNPLADFQPPSKKHGERAEAELSSAEEGEKEEC